MKRDISLDIAKGIAILMVVLGHVICEIYDNTSFNTNILFKICYSVHMPLFFFISGFLARIVLSRTDNLNRWIIKRTLCILVPYFIWTIIKLVYLGERNLGYRLFVDPVYWFLINLWIYHTITWVSVNLKNKIFSEVLMYMLFITCYIFVKDSNLVVKNVVMFFPFYVLGKIIGDYRNNKRLMLLISKLERLAVVLYPIAMIIFTYKEYDRWVPLIKDKIDLPISIIHSIMLFYNHYVVAFLGIGFILFFCKWAEKGKCERLGLVRVIEYFGRTTLPIYVLHEYFFVSYGSCFMSALGSFIVSIIISIVCYQIVSIFPKFSQVLFGSSGKLSKKNI